MRHRTVGSLFAVALLSTGCFGNLRPAAQAEYDFGPMPALTQPAMTQPAMPVRLGVTAPSWLSGTAMHYRLLHAAPAQRHAYAESRWAAPPAELLRLHLQRRLASADIPAGCRFRVDLVEFEQVFTAPAASHVRLAARVRSGLKLQLGIDIEEAAPTPDARGGVAAAGRAVDRLATRLAQWLATPAVAAQCNRGANEDGK
jgi:cholesterol transport system auxiliary component